MKSMRIAVTGCSGHIGRVIVRELLARGHKVIGLDRRPDPEAPCPFHQVDLRERAVIAPLFEQVEVVVHLGEMPCLIRGLRPDEVYASNTQTGATVMQTAADTHVRRLIYSSSCQVYGAPFTFEREGLVDNDFQLPLVETQPFRPQNAYAAGKVANEAYAAALADASPMGITVFRFPGVVWDAADDEEMWTRRSSHCDFYGGMGVFVHAVDIATAMSLAIEKDRPGLETYHLSATETLLAEPLAEHLRQYHPTYVLPRDWPDYASPVCTAKARKQLGWIPQFSVQDILRRHRLAKSA